MLEFIAIHRLPFVVVVAALLAIFSWRGGWRSRLMGLAAGVMIGSGIVIAAIMLNATQLWWLPPAEQTPTKFDVPDLLKPLVAPIEALAVDQLHFKAGLVAMRFLAYYTVSLVAAMILFVVLMIWQYISLQHNVSLLMRERRTKP